MGAHKNVEMFDYNLEKELAPIYGLKIFLMEKDNLLSKENYDTSCKMYDYMLELQSRFREYIKKRGTFFEGKEYSESFSESIEDSLRENSQSRKAIKQIHLLDDISDSMYSSWKEVRTSTMQLFDRNVMKEICDTQNSKDPSLTIGMARRYGLSFYAANWMVRAVIIDEIIKNRILPSTKYIEVDKATTEFREVLDEVVAPFFGVQKTNGTNKVENNFYV